MTFTVFTSGTLAKSSEINANFNACVYYKDYSVTTERTNYPSAWDDTLDTFDITHPANSQLLGISFKADLKCNLGRDVGARIKITGATLTTQYTMVANGHNPSTTYVLGTSGTAVTNSWLLELTAGDPTNYTTHEANAITNLNLPDTTTTFTVQVGTSTMSGETVKLKNCVIRVYYSTAVSG